MLVAVPFTAILEWPMGTAAGIATFMNPKVNAMFKKMFDVWAEFLSTPESCHVLHSGENGWLGPAAGKAMPDFAKTFECDTSAQYHGFTSWDNFFTRPFRPGSRPLERPDDNSVISNACESTAYRLAHHVKTRDSFWVKGQPYSLFHMLNNDPFAPLFANGTVYQGFLNPFDYHRWHSPVDGKIIKTVSVPGTYFAESPAFGFANPAGPDPLGPSGSQAFVTAVATRMLVFIEADNTNIGLMCFMAVGMTEVSTCEISVKVGDRIKKGDQLGVSLSFSLESARFFFIYLRLFFIDVPLWWLEPLFDISSRNKYQIQSEIPHREPYTSECSDSVCGLVETLWSRFLDTSLVWTTVDL